MRLSTSKITIVLAQINLASSKPTPSAADASPAPIDLGLIGTVAPPLDIDISLEYQLGIFDFMRNTSWAITSRPSGAVWIHKSRWHLTEKRSLADRQVATEERSFAETFQINTGTNRNVCPALARVVAAYACYGDSYSTGIGSGGSMTANWNTPNRYADSGYVPKINFYSDRYCKSYIFSMVGEYGCVAVNQYFFSVLPFNQAL